MVRTVLALVFGMMFVQACGDDASPDGAGSSALGPDCPCRLATKFENLALCVSPSTAFAPAHVYSTSWDVTKKAASCEPYRDPQPAPAGIWTPVRVSSDCQGTGELCVTIKAGDLSKLSAEDCTLAQRCSAITYTTPKQIVELASFAGWSAESSACAQRQEQLGAYLEFAVRSEHLGCGMGTDQISRVAVCPPRCQGNPQGAGCEVCGDGMILTTF